MSKESNKMSKVLADHPNTSLFYKKKFLDQNPRASDFLKAVTYSVHLDKLMMVKRTCNYHENMPYCPVLLEIIDPRIRQEYGGNYILQVWNKRDDLVSWNIFYKYLAFKMDKREEQEQWIYIIHFFDDKIKTMKVKDYAPDESYIHLGVNQELLYYANFQTILIVDIKKDFGTSNELILTPAADEICKYEIKPPCRLHGFFENGYSKDDQYIMCMIELNDNQIDFTRLYFWSRDPKAPDIEFYQYREIVERTLRNDPVVKIAQVVKANEFQFGLVLRQSGKIDFYWNFTLVSSPPGKYDDVAANFNSLFIRDNGNQKMHEIEISWDSRVGMDVSSSKVLYDSKWHAIKYNLAKESVKIYSSFTLVHTVFFVAFNNCVSIYDIVKKQWINHFFFAEEVQELLRNKEAEHKYGLADYNVGVLLKSGMMSVLSCQLIENEGIWAKDDKIGALKIEGAPMQMVSDWRDVSTHYIVAGDGQKASGVFSYQNNIISNLTSIVSLKENDVFTRFIAKDEQLDFAVFNKNDQKIKVFRNLSWGVGNVSLDKEYEIKDAYLIEGKVHTIVQTSVTTSLFLFDEKNIYVYDIAKKTIRVNSGYNMSSVQAIDECYIYALSNEFKLNKEQNPSGLYFMDLDNFFDPDSQPYSLRLKKSVVGVNNLFDYYREDQRLAYMADYESIKIVPLLHRNVINFIGMKDRREYLAFLRKKDKFIALDKDNYLTTWDVTTGKMEQQNKLKTPIVTPNFEIYQTDFIDCTYLASWYMPRLLLIDPTSEHSDINEDDYFGDRYKCALENSTAYTKIEEKKFRQFKMIEVISETECKEHFTFMHPHYGKGNYQRIYFSDDLQYMLERLVNQRVFLYKRNTIKDDGSVTWNIVKRISQFPKDMSEYSYNNYLFSPDLMHYLDFDLNKGVFQIKRTLDQSVFCEVEKGLMSPRQGEQGYVARRFRWINNQTIRVTNSEGVEKIVDITNGFKVLNQGTIPMFKFELEGGKHYYFTREGLPLQDTKERLQIKYQEYFSAYYLEGINDVEQLNEILFSVDHAVNRYGDKLVIDMSFTYLHWMLAELFSDEKSSKKIKFRKLNEYLIKSLLLNVFPQGQNALHICFKNLNIIRKLFNRIDEFNARLTEEQKLTDQFEIPFLQNYAGESPIHRCIKDENLKAADILLNKLSDDPLDSHARSIVDAIPDLIDYNIPAIGPYLDKRFITTKQFKGLKGALKKVPDADYALCIDELWPNIDKVKTNLLSVAPVESELKVCFFDMPNIHSYNDKTGRKFFKSLENADIEMFQYKAIKAVIDYKWPLAKEFTIKILFIPFVIFHAIFIVYSNVFNGQYEFSDEHWLNAHTALSILLYIFSVYFLVNEMRQLIILRLEYLKSIWNYSDLIPPCLIIVVVSLKLSLRYNEEYVPNEFLNTVHSLASGLMWVKLIYFLRIFRETGYLVRMLTDVVYGMRIFLLILAIVYFCFGEAFLRLSESSEEDARFIFNYAYAFVYAFRLSLGDMATDTFNATTQPVTLWILWMLSAVLTNIVMLNLLIAIISEEFAKINSNQEKALYQERARIISENSYLIPHYRVKQLDDLHKYLILAEEQIAEDEDAQQIQDQVTEINKKIDGLQLEFKNSMEDIVKRLEEIKQKAVI